MRWTVRGIPTDKTAAVRDVAAEFACTLGVVLALCVEYGLPEARRCLQADCEEEVELAALLSELRQDFSAVREALSSVIFQLSNSKRAGPL
jgi:hypothetical protein